MWDVVTRMAPQHLPYGRRLRPADLQEVVALLQLKVGEDQGDGVPGLGQDGPRAVGIIFVLRREVGAGNAAACAPQGSPAGALGCKGQRERWSHTQVHRQRVTLEQGQMVPNRKLSLPPTRGLCRFVNLALWEGLQKSHSNMH